MINIETIPTIINKRFLNELIGKDDLTKEQFNNITKFLEEYFNAKKIVWVDDPGFVDENNIPQVCRSAFLSNENKITSTIIYINKIILHYDILNNELRIGLRYYTNKK